MIIIRNYILVGFFLSLTISANSQEIISEEIQNKIGIHFLNQMSKQRSKFNYLYKSEFEYEKKYWQQVDTIGISRQSYSNYEQMKSFNLLYMNFLHHSLDQRNILSDLVMNSKSDTLHIIISYNTSNFKKGIGYWEGNKMDTVYFINSKYFDNYKREDRYLLAPDMSYTKCSNSAVIKRFFCEFAYRKDGKVLQFANSFSEWVNAYKKYPTYSRLKAVSDGLVIDNYLYIKVYIPQEDKLQFEFVDFVLFVH